MVHQFECQGKNIFRTETVVDCHFVTEESKSDPNAIIEILCALGWLELKSTLEDYYERNREKLVEGCLASTHQ
jgi:hypothetical protein